MGYAYTPGLTVAEHTVIRKVRRLPLKGTVLVQPGQSVEADAVVAETSLPGDVKPINAVGKLGIGPEELPQILLKQEGASVAANEPFARTKGLFGLFKSELRSPIDGSIESVSGVTGQVIIRGLPTKLQKTAYAKGRVVEVEAGESATVEISGTFVQGIFGIGPETHGVLTVVVAGADQPLDADRILPEHAGHIIAGGSLVTAAAVKKAIEVGVAGIIAGGLDDADLRDFLGYELGVAITGEENLGLTLMITEGFGPISMALRTFELLKKRSGLAASMNGATQIRAGVIRPELVIPLEGAPPTADDEDDELSGTLRIGTPLRAIRDPFFGRIGKCVDLPVELVQLSSETKVRVLEAEFDGGERAILPRANVELIKQ